MGLFRKDNEKLICPKCGSSDKELGFDENAKTYVMGGSYGGGAISSQKIFKCKKCNYEGLFVTVEK